MKKFIVYRGNEILRSGVCPDGCIQAQKEDDGNSAMEGEAKDITQKIVDGKVVDKTPAEIGAEKSPITPVGKLSAPITNEQWESVLKRLEVLEKV